jgi:hypothetical protein
LAHGAGEIRIGPNRNVCLRLLARHQALELSQPVCTTPIPVRGLGLG